jgi:hypothetical protein
MVQKGRQDAIERIFVSLTQKISFFSGQQSRRGTTFHVDDSTPHEHKQHCQYTPYQKTCPYCDAFSPYSTLSQFYAQLYNKSVRPLGSKHLIFTL